MKKWKGLLVLLLTMTMIGGCSSNSQGQKEEPSVVTQYEEVIKGAGDEKEEILAIMDHLNQNTTSLLCSTKDTTLDNEEYSHGQTQFWKCNNGFCEYIQKKYKTFYYEFLCANKYKESIYIDIVQDDDSKVRYEKEQEVELREKIFDADYTDLKVSKQNNNADNTYVYHLESQTTYYDEANNEVKAILHEEINVNEDAQIVYIKNYVVDYETGEMVEGYTITEKTYSKYNEDVSIDEEGIHRSMKELEGKKSKDVQDFIKI